MKTERLLSNYREYLEELASEGLDFRKDPYAQGLEAGLRLSAYAVGVSEADVREVFESYIETIGGGESECPNTS